MCTSVCPPLLSLFEESEVSFEPAQPGHSGNGLKPNAHKHVRYFLVCMGLYLSKSRSDQEDRGLQK